MNTRVMILLAGVFFLTVQAGRSVAVDPDVVLKSLSGAISGDRSRDYTLRIWRYDRWCTLPMWKRSAGEARTIMRERAFEPGTR